MTTEITATITNGTNQKVVTPGRHIGETPAELIEAAQKLWRFDPATTTVTFNPPDLTCVGTQSVAGIWCEIYRDSDWQLWAKCPGVGNNWSVNGHAQKYKQI